MVARSVSRLFAGAILFLLVVWPAEPVAAHPIVVRTLPQAGSGYAEAPTQMGLEFDEPVTVRSLTVSGQARGKIQTSRPSRSPEGTTVTITADEPLQDGIYTVHWEITATDGDVVEGAFGFSVGVRAGSADETTSAAGDVSAAATVLRWIMFGGLALAAGGVVGDAMVRDRARRARQRSGVELEVVRPWVLTGSVVGLGAVLGLVIVQLGPGGVLDGTPAVSFDELAQSRAGRILIVEAIAFLAAAVAAWRAKLLLSLAALAAVVCAEAIRSHANARLGWVGAATIGVHLGVAALWVGALVHVVRAAWRWRNERRQVVAIFRRYARRAIWGYVLVLGTGAVAAVTLVPSWDALTATTYGRVLLLKLAAVIVVTGLALTARRGLAKPISTHRWRGLRFARLERLALAGVLLGSAALTATSPTSASSGSAYPPPVAEPAVYVGGLAGQVSMGLIASEGSMQVRLNVPEITTNTAQRYRLRGKATRPNGGVSRLRLVPCGLGCFSSDIVWPDGDTRIALSVQAKAFTGGTLNLVVPWPARDGRPVFERGLDVMADQRDVRIAEEVTSNTKRPEGMSSRIRISGSELLDAQPYRAGIVSNVTVLDRGGGGTEIGFALPAESIFVSMTIDRDGLIRSEQISSPNHLISRIYSYPDFAPEP